jgi:hypothetical protein
MTDARTDPSPLPGGEGQCDGGNETRVRRAYVLVLVVEAVVLAALWFLQASFNA